MYFSYKYNLTFSCFSTYLLCEIENMEVFVYCVIKMCSQFNISVSFMKSSFSFAKDNENMMCIFGNWRRHANILLWNIGRVSLEIAPIIESLKIIHCAMVRIWEYQNIFVKCWPYYQETQQIDFGTLIDFEI